MRVFILGQSVEFNDEKGNVINITKQQLSEMIRILNVATREDGEILFKTLEFTV